jgi:curved DNA-binding protein
MSNYYDTLGIKSNADQEEIKRAYRKLAAQHHPDKAGGNTEKFQEIQAAYETLSDPQRRAEHDNPQPQFHGPGGFHFNFGGGGGVPPGFEHVFAHFNGGNHPFGDMFGRPQKNRNLNLQTEISLEDAYNGKELMANFRLPSGREQTLELKVPPGVQDGTVIRLSGMGDDSIPQLPRGDVHLTVHVTNHPVWARQNDDLIKNIDVNCLDAIVGKTISVEAINGAMLEVNIQPGTQHGQMLAVQGYGMPNLNNPSIKGKMLLHINITIPRNLSEADKSLIRQLLS